MNRRNAPCQALPMVLLVGPLLLSGCDLAELKKAANRDTRYSTRRGDPGHPNNTWIGSNVRDLIQSRGEPASVINATLLGGKPSAAYVYPSLRNDGCVDAFVVSVRTGEIIDYFCR